MKENWKQHSASVVHQAALILTHMKHIFLTIFSYGFWWLLISKNRRRGYITPKFSTYWLYSAVSEYEYCWRPFTSLFFKAQITFSINDVGETCRMGEQWRNQTWEGWRESMQPLADYTFQCQNCEASWGASAWCWNGPGRNLQRKAPLRS